MRSGFVTMHGIDGTGKSSTVDAVVSGLHSHGVDAVSFSSGVEYQNVFQDVQLGSRDSRYAALYKSLAVKSIQGEAVRAAVKEGRLVVKDRWVIDVLAANAFHGAELDTTSLGICVPDMSYVLTCDELERMNRIQLRGDATQDDLISNQPGTRANYFENYLLNNISRLATRSRVIDTTYVNTEVTAEKIVEEILNT